mmetsp:Transcript_2785/g.4698  ORF Transcript_2785/g.4698 Transcript_2785/m.4698 type:complete len:305 (+) Transcript_2785:761-1675(+)
MHLISAQLGKVEERGLDAHLLAAARHVNGNALPRFGEVELVHQVLADELYRLVEGELEGRRGGVLDGGKAGAGVAHNGDAPTVRRLQQGLLQLTTCHTCSFLESAAVEEHPAALAGDVLRVDDLIAGLFEEREQLVMHGARLRVAARRAHGARHAGWHVHYLECAFSGLCGRLKWRGPLRHVLVPCGHHISGEGVQLGRHKLQHRVAQHTMEHVHRIEQLRHVAVERRHVVSELHGDPLRLLVLAALHLLRADLLDHVSGVDLHGALLLAHPVSGACGLAVVGEEALELVQPRHLLGLLLRDVV